jgi:hypothetical protein
MTHSQTSGQTNTDKDKKMERAKKAPGAQPKTTRKLDTYAKQVEDYKTGKRTYAPVKPGKTGQSGYTGTVSQAVIAQVKKDGMAKALEKVATYKSPSSPYIEAAFRLYGKSRVQAAMSSPAAQKKLSTAGTGGENPGKFMSPSEIKKFMDKANKANLAIPKAMLNMLKKPGR